MVAIDALLSELKNRYGISNTRVVDSPAPLVSVPSISDPADAHHVPITECVVVVSGDVKSWIKYAISSHNAVILIMPARTNTSYFHDLVLRCASSVFFVRGRLTFRGNTTQSPYPSAVAIFGEPQCKSNQMQVKFLSPLRR